MVWKAAKDGETRLRGCKTLTRSGNTLLEDGKTRTRGWTARWWRNANSWLQDLKTLLERTRNTAIRRRYAKLLLARPWSTARRPRGCRMTSTRQHLAHLLKYYPRPPCAPSLIKSRFFSHTTIYSPTSLHFWNSLYVYTRGILGCLLGFWPLGQNPAGAKTHRRCACILFSDGHKWEKVVCRMKKWKRNDLLYSRRKFSSNR